MTTAIEAPRPGTGIGCFGRGCLIFFGLLLFLVIAFVGGGFWALRHFQNTYSSRQPLSFANVTASEAASMNDGAVPEGDATTQTDRAAAPQSVQQTAPGGESVRELQARWRAFEKAADRHQPASVELTASEINSLIQNDPKLRDKAAVSVENNTARVRVSIPLDKVFLMNGRYLNGEATVVPSPDGDPSHAQISNIVLGNQSVPDDVLDRRLFGWTTMRGYVTDWLNDKDINYFNIENNRVIGKTRAAR